MFRTLGLTVTLLATLATLVCAQETKKKYVKDMAETDFTKRELEGKDMANHNLENCTFHFAKMKKIILTGSNLSGSDFKSASLDGANLSGCDLRKTKFEYAGASECNFEKADLRGADLSTCTVYKSNFKGADLRDVKGIKHMIGADFTGADLRGANLQETDIYFTHSAIFKDAKYDKLTRWPRGFDIEKSGAVFMKPEEKK